MAIGRWPIVDLMTSLMALCSLMTMIGPLMLTDIRHACTMSEDSRVAVCKQQNLSEPPQYLPDGVQVLDLSGNRIKIVIAEFWIRYPYLRQLNLSSCGLSILRDTSFSGLQRLQVLDLTNNPVLAYLPRKVFSNLSSLRTLLISGEVVPPEVLSGLHDLEELTMTFRDRPPLTLARLRKLKVLTFAFSTLVPSGGEITADMLEHLANSSIEELAFHRCEVSKIAHGSFDYLSRLKLLNFACNSHLQISNVIDVLSTMKNPRPVESLILDGTQNTFTIFGQQEAKRCMPAWRHLRRLSLRNTNLYGFNVNFVAKCLTGLESLTLGFNYPFFLNLDSARSFFAGNNALRWLFQHAPANLVSVDASYLLTDDQELAKRHSGCSKDQSWIPKNWDLFPAHDNHKTTLAVDEYPTAQWSAMLSNELCSIVQLPRNLTFLDLHDIGESQSFFSSTGYSCVVVLANSLRHLNLSASNLIGSKKYLGSIYGLRQLQTLDLAYNGLVEFNFAELANFPSLGALHLNGNELHSGRLSTIGRHEHLTSLDLSDNRLTTIPRGMFSDLTSLRVLNLRGNRLETIDFVTDNLVTLSVLDVGYNQLQIIGKDGASILDNLFSKKGDFVLKLDSNPFQCMCSSKGFIQWMRLTRINIERRHKLICLLEGKSRMYIANIDVSALNCTGR